MQQGEGGLLQKQERDSTPSLAPPNDELSRFSVRLKIVAVFSETAPGRSGGCGAEGQPSAFVNPSKTPRVAPSSVTHSLWKQSRKTPPSGVSKEKKLGRRNKFERWEWFFSSASEY